jgi:drug/metabolite transporter (DMT)-like permease
LAWSIGYGEVVALFCAGIWAASGLIMRHYVSLYPPAFLNALRCGAAAVFAWALMPFAPPMVSFLQVTNLEWVMLAGSVLLAIGVGDTLYMVSLREIGVPRALAISGSFPLPTLFFEWLLFDHDFSSTFVAGCGLVVAGVVFLSTRTTAGSPVPGAAGKASSGRAWGPVLGTTAGLAASVAWGLGTLFTTKAIAQLTAIQANSIRLPLVSVTLFLMMRATGYKPRGSLNRRSLLIICLSGVLGMGLGSYLYLEALQQIGAAKTTTLAATAPLFGLIMAMLLFGEKADVRTVAGIALCICGVWLVL